MDELIYFKGYAVARLLDYAQRDGPPASVADEFRAKVLSCDECTILAATPRVTTEGRNDV